MLTKNRIEAFSDGVIAIIITIMAFDLNLVSTLLYLATIPLAYISVYLSFAVFVAIPVWYFLPDRFHK